MDVFEHPVLTREEDMTKPISKSIRDMLIKMRRELVEGISDSTLAEKDVLKRDIGDMYDHASNERDRELKLLLNERERDKLNNIDAALERIEDGTFGLCEECGEKIQSGRIKAMPFTLVCVQCKSIEEKERGKFKRLDDRGSYRKVSFPEGGDDGF